MSDPGFPLGVPVNRREEPMWLPIEGRPGWMRHRNTGEEVYLEAAKPKPWPFPISK